MPCQTTQSPAGPRAGDRESRVVGTTLSLCKTGRVSKIGLVLRREDHPASTISPLSPPRRRLLRFGTRISIILTNVCEKTKSKLTRKTK
ncbi:hypothetical protein F9B82_03055 [Lacticaseibacillus casei]|nr:hypothetical protein F9B82_03055 [Lacticaseibacillus casei]